MSILTDAATAAVTTARTAFVTERRARLQSAFTDSTGKVLVDVSKLTQAHIDQAAGLLVFTDGTVDVAVTRDGFRVVSKEPDGTWTSRGDFTTLLDLGLLLGTG